MSNNVDIGPRKTMFILVVVIGCFAVLWPKVFYPMLVGSANQQMKPSSIDKTAGCCDVISDTDVNTIKILTELCNSIVRRPSVGDFAPLSKDLITQCRKQVLSTCGIDIELILHHQVRLGQSVKQILSEVRSLNGSLCLKYNFGVQPWRLGVPHRITVNLAQNASIRQERPTHLRPELLHPALRERGRAIPATNANPPRIVEGRPGPIPGMRPPMGSPGHVPPSQKGTSTMSVVMPIYTIGIVIFFTYTLMKLMFKKPVDSATNGLYPSVQPDPNFRKQVFESERTPYVSRHKDESTTKLGWKERDTIVNAMSALLAEVDQQREEDARFRAEIARQSEVTANGNIANGTVVNGNAVKPHDSDQDSTSVKVLGMEMTASCEGGQKWSRPNTPIIPATPPPPAEPVPPPQSIYLEGALPAQSQLLVAESATETETAEINNSADPAVVLSGKMTLSVISLDSLPGQENDSETNKEENAKETTKEETTKEIKKEVNISENNKEEIFNENNKVNADEEEEEDDEIIEEIIEEEIIVEDEDEKVEESKYTTASYGTSAENEIPEDKAQITDSEEEEEEIEED